MVACPSEWVVFLCYGDHRDLHSFPTRRSSGLEGGEIDLAIALRGVGIAGPHQREIGRHTSELQSRQYLVCRLLLEKKKQQPQPASLRGQEVQCNPAASGVGVRQV